MDARLIERLDRRRYIYLLWAAIGFAMWGGCLIANEFIAEDSATSLLKTLSKLALLVFITGTAARGFNEYRINNDANLKKAIDNELTKHYEYKSFKIAFWTMCAIASILLMIEPEVTILTAKISCLIILHLSVMTYLVSYLIYLRR